MEADLASLKLWGTRGATIGKEKRDGCEGRPAFMGSIWNVGVGRWHLAAAEDISLGLSCCGDQVVIRAGIVSSAGAVNTPFLGAV